MLFAIRPLLLPETPVPSTEGIRAATSQFSGAGEGGAALIAFEAAVTNDALAVLRYVLLSMLLLLC